MGLCGTGGQHIMKDTSNGWKPDRRKFLEIGGSMVLASMLENPAFTLSQANPVEGAQSTKRAQKVIIDTDPGVDDAFALLLAMRSPELQIEAITPVAGNVPLSLTLPNALRMVEIAGREDIPVAAGASAPLIRRLVTASYAHGENGLGGAVFPVPHTQPVKEPAPSLICRIVRENPGEITIIGIGPLTNVAMALRQEPEMANKVRGIVLMGGSLSGGNVTPGAEFNFYVDPEAASLVFDSGIPITMVGLDVTRKVTLTENYVRSLEAGHGKVSQAAAKIARNIEDLYQKQRRASGQPPISNGGPNMHDPLAVSSLIRPDILTFEDYHIEIETSGDLTAGESVGWKHGPLWYSAPLDATHSGTQPANRPFAFNARVATGVDPKKFFDLLISRLLT